MNTSTSNELLMAVITGAQPIYQPNTGVKIEPGVDIKLSPGAQAGFEAPRFCQICGRKMAVQIRPDGYSCKCSRHGELDSKYLERR